MEIRLDATGFFDLFPYIKVGDKKFTWVLEERRDVSFLGRVYVIFKFGDEE